MNFRKAFFITFLTILWTVNSFGRTKKYFYFLNSGKYVLSLYDHLMLPSNINFLNENKSIEFEAVTNYTDVVVIVLEIKHLD